MDAALAAILGALMSSAATYAFGLIKEGHRARRARSDAWRADREKDHREVEELRQEISVVPRLEAKVDELTDRVAGLTGIVAGTIPGLDRRQPEEP